MMNELVGHVAGTDEIVMCVHGELEQVRLASVHPSVEAQMVACQISRGEAHEHLGTFGGGFEGPPSWLVVNGLTLTRTHTRNAHTHRRRPCTRRCRRT